MDLGKLTDTDFQVKEGTLSLYKAVKENPLDKIEVEIGDSKDIATFQPQAKIMRWDNEVNLSVRYKDEDKSEPVVASVDGVVQWVKPDKEVRVYEKPEIDEDGGLEIEVVLKEKPVSNIIEFSIETKGLEFFYQPELEDSEVEELAQREGITLLEAKRKCRPENVVGSYAVYYKDVPGNVVGGKEYKVGKLCHIYRPKVTDAEGNSIWGELNIDEASKLLQVTVDDKWLDKAVYPVVVDPTFGYTTAGASYENFASNYFRGSSFTAASDGTIDSVSRYVEAFYTYTKNIVVLTSNLNIVTNGISPQIRTPNVYGYFWRDISYTLKPTVSSGVSYVLGEINDSYSNFKYDTGSAGQGYADNTNSRTSPSNPTDATTTTQKFSIYATYTEAASGPTGVKTINATAIAGVKTINGLAVGSVKKIN